jgi:excisionase family DNA binding protein
LAVLERHYSIDEVCQLLGRRKTAIYRLMQLGLLTYCRIAGRRFIPESSIEQLLEDSRVTRCQLRRPA